ncbi:MAG: DNA alkylation repair protein [Psychrosphaera sp.]|nr:DNA alkylation repair protein [Psychrosphaera sp.]
MNTSDVLALLEQNQNERGLEHWAKFKHTGGLKSFGIGLTQLRKLAKKVGRNHELALELWQTDNHDAKIIGLLIDEPKKITREQAEAQVEGLGIGSLTHVFSSCDATLAKAPIAFDVAKEWLDSDHKLRRQSAYGLVYELSKNKRNKNLTDEFFVDCINRIEAEIGNESGNVKSTMGGALMGIGKRNKVLNQRAIVVATKIGPIDFNEDGGTCDPFNVLKHLTTDSLKEKLG